MSVDAVAPRTVRDTAGRLGWWLVWFALPLVTGLWIVAETVGGTLWPWSVGMIDLDVYRRTGYLLLAGQDFYAAEGLPWIYPPFAALLAVPLALVSQSVAQIAWIAVSVLLLMAMLYRLGLKGWWLSLATTASVWLAEPVRETLGFGQVGILLVAAVVLDSMPGPRMLPRRILPEGTLIGIAAAVKLTPALMAVYLFFAGRRRPAWVAFGSFCAATVLAFIVLPGPSLSYFKGLAGGESGNNGGILFKTNQSIMGVWSRLFGELSSGGLAVSAVVALAGIAVAVLVHRAGQEQLALCLAGVTSLLASPISWSHHYVWIVPLTVVLVQRRELPLVVRVPGLIYAAWTLYAPFHALPGGDGAELRYTAAEQVVVNLGVGLGLLFIAVCGVAAWRARTDARFLPAAVLT